MKLLLGNIGANLHELGLGQGFVDRTKSMNQKKKKKLDLFRI